MTGRSHIDDLEVVALPDLGRRFTTTRRVRFSDTDQTGRLRTDAAARYLQDVAQDDIRDAGHDPLTPWIARRTVLVGERWPRLDDLVDITTFGSGVGRSWGERRTIIEGADTRLDAIALWIHLDLETGTPKRLPPEFHDAYDEAIGGRKVNARLRLRGPVGGRRTRSWQFRHADVDPFGHVNNAATWTVVEEELQQRGLEPRYAELEYNEMIPPAETAQVHVAEAPGPDGTTILDLWLSTDDRTLASARIRAHPTR